MSRIAIVTDSTANLPAELIARHGVHVVPLYVHFGEEAFRDGVDLDAASFYGRLTKADTLPTTSQPSAGDFIDVYRRLAREADAVLSIHISSKLSGTVASALAARQTLQDEASAGGEGGPEIHVVDSLVTSGSLALLVTAAVRLVEADRPAGQIAAAVQELIPKLTTIFVVDTLEYLRKGGRIGGAAALVGSMIQVRPILQLTDGRIEVLEKVRTTKKAKERLLEIMQERAGHGTAVRAAVIHAEAPDEAARLGREASKRFDCIELMICDLSPAIGTHVGPGTVGLAFYC